MITSAFAFAVTASMLLATPGPTNTLLAASGAVAGVRRSLKLTLAEMSGYLVSVTALVVVLGGVVAGHPGVALGIKLGASLWLAWCAVELWREAGQPSSAAKTPVTMWRVFVTTLLNPKALVFAFVIFPQGLGFLSLLPWLVGFMGLVAVAGTGWIFLGALLARSAGGFATPRRISFAASVALASFAALVAGQAVAVAISRGFERIAPLTS